MTVGKTAICQVAGNDASAFPKIYNCVSSFCNSLHLKNSFMRIEKEFIFRSNCSKPIFSSFKHIKSP